MEYYTRTDNHACSSPKDMRTLSAAKRSCPERCGLVQAEGHLDECHGWKPCACPRVWRSFQPLLPRPAAFCWELRQAGRERILKSAACSPEQCGAMVWGVLQSTQGTPGCFPMGSCVWTGVGIWSRPLLPHPSPISKERPWSWRYTVPPPLPDLETASHLPNFSSERLGL